MTIYNFTIDEKNGITPKSADKAKKGDTVTLTRVGTNVLGLRVTLRYTDPSHAMVVGLHELFGTQDALFQDGQTSITLQVSVALVVATTFDMEPILATSVRSMPGKNPYPTEKGAIIVVGGTGPVPYPDKLQRIRPRPYHNPVEVWL